MKIAGNQQINDTDISHPKHLYTELEQLNSRIGFQRSQLPMKKTEKFEIANVQRSQENTEGLTSHSRSFRKEKYFSTKKGAPSNHTPFASQLKDIVHKQKVNSIVKNFQQKIRRNNPETEPVEYEPYNLNQQQTFLNRSGLSISKNALIVFSFLSIFQTILLCFSFSLILVFPFLRDEEIFLDLSIFSFIFYILEIVMNLFAVREKEGKKIIRVQDIMKDYFYGKFFIDILCLLILLLDMSVSFYIMRYLRLIVFLKLGSCFQKLEFLENTLINSFYKEQYWGLAKVFLLNFFFAHILSICLLAMASLTTKNWLTKVNALHAPWYEKYAWAYYWGTTTMLTVGYGDLSATNYIQAICLTFIETFSCIALAYNINCVGTLISNIRSQDIEKQRKFKIMHQLSTRNQLPEQLHWKVNNYIEETCKMKKIFNLEEEKSFISSLPPGLKTNFLKESNKKIFQDIAFFTNFTERTLINLAQQLEMFVAYPEEIIYTPEKASTLMILHEGKVGYCTKLPGSSFNETIVNEIRVDKKDSPSLLSLDFLFHRLINYEIKSLKYSIIYQFQSSLFKEISKTSKLDFQNLCMMIDRSHHVLDEHQLVQCSICQIKHTKMRCPRIHFIPIKQHVINKHLGSIKISRSQRDSDFKRPQKIQNHYLCSKNFEGAKGLFDNNLKDKRKSGGTKKASIENQSLDNGVTFHSLARLQTEMDGIFEKTIEEISENIKILLNREQLLKEVQTTYWNIECDQIADFKFYFPNENAKLLKQKYPGF